MSETLEQAVARYEAAAHAMQTGVATMMNYDQTQTDPKHMRVGVNSAQVTAAALATLLIDKGIFTREEYYSAIADAMEREVETYTNLVNDAMGAVGPDGNRRITLQ